MYMKKFVKILLIFLTIIAFTTLRHTYVYALQPSSDVIYNGIDVSNYQGYIDYAQVKQARNRSCIYKVKSRYYNKREIF